MEFHVGELTPHTDCWGAWEPDSATILATALTIGELKEKMQGRTEKWYYMKDCTSHVRE